MKKVRLAIAFLLLITAAEASMNPIEEREQTIQIASLAVAETVPADSQTKATSAPPAAETSEAKPIPTATLIIEPLYIYKDGLIEDPALEPTPEPPIFNVKEMKLIARVVYAEARGEGFEGQVAVAQVVINRYLSGKFGKTVKKVVFAPHQFAVGKRYNDENMRAVEAAIADMPHPETMFFFQVSKRKKWRNFEYYRRIGNHSFYLAGTSSQK